MTDYQELYATLFNTITEVIKILEYAQEAAERLYIESGGGGDGKIIRFPG